MPQAAPILGNIAINLAIGVGASIIAGLLRPPQSKGNASTLATGTTLSLTFGDDVSLFTIVGRAPTAGHMIFAQPYGDNNEYLKLVIVCGKGHFDAFESLIVDGELATLSGSNGDTDGQAVGGKWTVSGTPYMWVKTYDGAPGQTADAGLIAAADPSDRWTSAHTLTGTPYAIVTLRWNSDLFGGTLPEFAFVWRGLRLYDWREDSTVDGGSGSQRWLDQSTWAWTENPAVIAYNWRRGIWFNGVRLFGLGFASTANDLSYFTETANLCDETVTYPETSTSLTRYAYGKQITDEDDRLDVLRELEAAWCGSSFSRGGAYAPVPAATQAAVMTLEDNDRLNGYSVKADKWGTVSAKKTAWGGSYTSKDNVWQTTAYGTRIDTSLETLLGGRKTAKFDQPYEYEVERAQMRAEIALRRQSYGANRTETFNPRAMVLEPGDCVTRVCDWGSVLMIVQSAERLPNNMGATLTLTEWNNAIVPASGEAFVTLPPGVGSQVASADRTLSVNSFSVTAVDRSIADGGTLPYARASWTLIADPNVDQVLIRYWPTSGTEADDGENVTADAHLQSSKLFGPLVPETDFTGYAIPIRQDGRTCTEVDFTFTSGSMTVTAAESDSLVAFKDWIGVRVRDLNEQLQLTSSLAADQDASNYSDRQYVLNEVTIGDSATYASSTQALLLALGDDGSSLADAIDAIEAASGDVTAGMLTRTTAIAGPSGWVRYAREIRAAIGDDLVTVGDYWEVNTGTGLSRRVMKASETYIVDDADNILAMFAAGGASFNTAYIADLTVDSLKLRGVDGYVGIDADAYLELLSTTTQVIDDNAITDLTEDTDDDGGTIARVATGSGQQFAIISGVSYSDFAVQVTLILSITNGYGATGNYGIVDLYRNDGVTSTRIATEKYTSVAGSSDPHTYRLVALDVPPAPGSYSYKAFITYIGTGGSWTYDFYSLKAWVLKK